ncbi:MAG TPA: PH domain-containing protein [Verrucomicrobiae bacterium]|nr:PH domain-containing protein [Verrucomicrobiae bacterium]
MNNPTEITLAKVRLHWGIFIPAIMSLVAMLFVGIMLAFLFHAIGSVFNQSNQPTSWLPQLMFFVILAIPVAFLFLQAWLIYSKADITLTNRRLVFNNGLFYARMSGELPLENIETIFIFESVLGRIFGWGSVTVTSIGGGRFPLRHISSPREFHAVLQQAVADAKSFSREASVAARPSQDDDSRFMPKS